MIAYTTAAVIDDVFLYGKTYYYSYSGNTRSNGSSYKNNTDSEKNYNGNSDTKNNNSSNRSYDNSKSYRSSTGYDNSSAHSPNSDEFNFFLNCETKEQIMARYRQLIKAFHPDTGNGDEKTAATINLQYEELMKKYK